MTKMFCTYMTFIMYSSNFSLSSLKEINVICKNNNIRIVLNSSFDISIFSSWSGRLDRLFQSKNIKDNELAVSKKKQKRKYSILIWELKRKKKKIILIQGFSIDKILLSFRRHIGFNIEKTITISLFKPLLLYQITSRP